MVQLIPSVQNHLRERLHNRKITMTVRVSAPTENIRAYSHVERFQMMSKKNPNLLKLKKHWDWSYHKTYKYKKIPGNPSNPS